jgi:hypothetical protein
MKYKLNSEELQNMIAKELRDIKLNNVLDIEQVKSKIKEKIKDMNGKEEINELGNPSISKVQPDFPKEEIQQQQPDNNDQIKKDVQTNSDNKIKPRIATFEIPDFLKNIEPGEIIIFNRDELSEGGENLTNKPFKTYADPNIEKSMNQMWSEEGKTHAKVYQAKFEEIGELIYDYKNGTTNFVEKQEQPQTNENGTYKENPYKTEPNPVLNKEIENYISQNVDLDLKINEILSNILKNYFNTNNTKAINDTEEPSKPVYNQPVQQNTYPVSEGFINTVDEMVNGLEKVDMPNELLESINGKSNLAAKIFDNGSIKAYKMNGKKYYLHSNPISLRKCYVKND